VGIENNHAMIAVAVRDIDLIGLLIDGHIGRAAEVLGVVAIVLGALMANLQQELPLLRELEDLRIAAAISGDPDVVFVVNEDAVFRLRPLVSLTRAAP